MIFRKVLLYGGLLLFATITVILSDSIRRSIPLEPEFVNPALINNTENENIANDTGYKVIANSTHITYYEQISDNTSRVAYRVINDTYNKMIRNYDKFLIYKSITIPLHYNSEIRFFSEDNILFGHCNIIILILDSVTSIMLYSAPIYVMDAILIGGENDTGYKLYNSSFNEKINILTLNFGQRLLHHSFPDNFILKMTYIRIMYENRKSFIKSAYQEKPEDQMLNQTVHIMEARQLFPCEDKTMINSTFKIAIKHDEKYTILSNTLIEARNKTDNGMMWTKFNESSMYAHQISIVITTFTADPSDISNVTLWCRQSVREHLFYAMNVLEEILPYFKQEFLKKLSKLDIIVFWYSEEEAYGLPGFILLREADVVYNEVLDPAIHQRKVAHTIARALAFLWCNTFLFWTEEGFVTFFAAYILNKAYQNNHMMNLLAMQTLQDSFRYDTPSKDSPTLDSEVDLFGFPNYMKSFIMWRMLYCVMPDVFWHGVYRYIERIHDYYLKATTLNDFLFNMQNVSYEHYPEDIHSHHLIQIMQSWITKRYYPLLNITHQNLTSFVDVIQFPYLSHLVNDNTEIWISLTITTQSLLNFNTDTGSWWPTTNKIEELQLLNPYNESDWIIFNLQQIGYYRVQYDLQNWHKLIHYLDSKDYDNIHILNRAQIIDDAFYFFLQKQLNYQIFWNLTNFMYRDTNFVTWYPLIKAFEMMTCIFPFGSSFHVVYGVTQEKIKQRIDKLLSKIGYYEKNTDHTLTIYLREEAIKWACIVNISKCQRTAATELETALENSVEIDYLKNEEWIYCYGLTTASHDIWYKIWQKWNTTSDERFLKYLTCSEDSIILCYFLKMTVLKQIQPENKQSSKLANAFLLVVAKYAERDAMHSCFFEIFENFTLSSNRRNDLIATLIVIITHVHKENHMTKILTFAKRILEEEFRVKKKLRKRRSEFGRLIENYGYYFSS